MKVRRSTLGLIALAAACFMSAALIGAHSREGGGRDAAPALGVDAPAGVRFVTVALGGFRGILADLLWLRAADLQDEGRFFEVAQLADWITRLQPRYPEVWAYHAWNMAYNITAVVADPADRWHWVRNGLRLLRDEGIPSNPRDPRLYWELGWMYYDKVGGPWDEATLYYRINWAREMSGVAGGGVMDYAVLGRSDEARRVLKAAGLDPVLMKAVDDAYGPLDWRLPESHALYWGYCGRPYQKAESPWCDRLVWMGMMETLKGGVLAFSPVERIYLQGPRLDIAVRGIRLCSRRAALEEPLVRLVMANFLRESAFHLYSFGRNTEAAVALEELKRLPDRQEGAVGLEEFVRREALSKVKALDQAGRQELVLRLLVRAESWRRLDVALYAAGYEQMALLHWEAWAGLDKAASGWDVLRGAAKERSLREMPDVPKIQPRTP